VGQLSRREEVVLVEVSHEESGVGNGVGNSHSRLTLLVITIIRTAATTYPPAAIPSVVVHWL